MTVIRFESFPIGDGFTFDSRYIHLTYKKHVRKCIIDAVFRRLTTIAGVADSHVWETVTHDDGSENDHTHYANARLRANGVAPDRRPAVCGAAGAAHAGADAPAVASRHPAARGVFDAVSAAPQRRLRAARSRPRA